jgi:hypothetical protein
MANSEKCCVTTGHVLFPLSIVAFVLMLSLGFQSSLIFTERSNMHGAIAQQAKAVEDSNKVQAQFSTLALGTKKLAASGNKNAAAIADQMKKAGITFQDETQQAAPAAAPAANAVPAEPNPAAKP